MGVKQILATKELVLNIGGIEYDVLLIPRDRLVDVNYKDCPEDDPRVKQLIEKIRKENQ